LRTEVTLLHEEIRIKDGRMASLAAARRPHYRALSRMAILELKSARGRNTAETARHFLLEPRTVASWMKRIDEGESLVGTPVPVNKYPDFVRYIVQRLRVLCPMMGKRKIAEVLARAGLHLGATTVRRMSQEEGPNGALDALVEDDEAASSPAIKATYPNHVWGIDLAAVPTRSGFWTMLSPFSSLQRWPFCYWVAVTVDHLSRKAMGFAVFTKAPTAKEITAFLGRSIRTVGRSPRYVITDKGKQFDCGLFRRWCTRRGILPRYGAVGKHGSIAVVERFIRTIKDECTRRVIVPMGRDRFRDELTLFFVWFNLHRPHRCRTGRTPDEVYLDRAPASERWRHEPRGRWPKESGCAAPWAEVRGESGVHLRLNVTYLNGRRHLPVVTLRRAG
jgi:transposase InsO family protein